MMNERNFTFSLPLRSEPSASCVLGEALLPCHAPSPKETFYVLDTILGQMLMPK